MPPQVSTSHRMHQSLLLPDLGLPLQGRKASCCFKLEVGMMVKCCEADVNHLPGMDRQALQNMIGENGAHVCLPVRPAA